MDKLTVIKAGWVVPVLPKQQVFADHAVVVEDDCILEIIPNAEVAERYPDAAVVDRTGHALLPGLVNAHTHSPMTLLRGIGDDMPLMPWLEERIWPVEGKFADASFIADGTNLALAEMIKGGTTAAIDMYFFPNVVCEVSAKAGFRMTAGIIVIEFPTPWAANPEEYFAKGLEMHDQYRSHPLITTTLAPHAPYTVSDASFERIRTLSNQLDIPVNVHLHETAGEVAEGLDKDGRRPFRRLADMGLMNENMIAVHMTQLEDHEISWCADNGVSVVHCPESNMKLASGFCPVEQMRQAGVNVALGTDGVASNNDLDMFGEMRTAGFIAKGRSGDATATPAHWLLEMATINGAKALGLEDKIGSIEAGKQADLVSVELDRLETLPMYDVISHLVYATGRHQVSDVWIAGRRVLKDRELTTLDEAQLLERARHWGQRIGAEIAEN